jgi:peptide/nickel transport system substrate-binding protein
MQMERSGSASRSRHRGRPARLARCASVAILVVAAAVTGVVSTAGARAPKAAAAAGKPVLRIGLPYSYLQYFANLAKVSNSGNSGALEASLAYSSLFHMEPDGQIVPELASSGAYFPTHTGRDRGFQFTLIHRVKFSDGTPLNAAAVVKWMSFYETQTGGYQTLFGPDPKFRAIGQWKVRITTSVAVPNMEQVLSDVGEYWGTIGSPACVANPTLFTNATCGTGPYELNTKATVPGSTYTYEPNPYYYDKSAVKYSSVVVSVLPAPSAELAALQAGQLNFAYIGSDSATVSAAKAAGLKVESTTVGAYQLVLNEKDPSTSALANVKVRQAISYAIDRPALAQLIAPGGYAKATDLFPVTDISDPGYANHFAYDPSKAKALLAKAGYPNGLTLNFALIQARTQDQTMFEGLAQELKAVGITINPVNYTSGASIFQNAGYLVTVIANASQVQYGLWMSPATNPIGTWKSDPTLIHLYNHAVNSSNPTPGLTQLLQYETDQTYYATIASVSGIWYVSKSVNGVDVTAPRIGAVLIGELSPS